VTLPTFKQESFTRFRHHCKNFDIYDAHDNFAGFPAIQSHVHPYFAIVNALPKLEAHFSVLTPEQQNLYFAMCLIANEWGVALHSSGPKRPRDDEDDADVADPSGGPPKRKKPCHGINPDGEGKPELKLAQVGHLTSTEGKGRQTKLDLSCAPPQDSYSSPPQSAKTRTNNGPFHFDDKTHILAWIDTVLAAGPLAQVPKDVIKSDGEKACPPFKGNWHDWCSPYGQPADTTLFCSTNWASYIYNCMLTMQPGCWDSPDWWDDSDNEE
jgi:hypothetical protein